MTKPKAKPHAGTGATPLALSAPTITLVGIVLNQNKVKSVNRSKTSRFFIKGTNFDTSGLLQVNLSDPNWICFPKVQDATHITVRAKFGSGVSIPIGETSNITVTVTNGDGGQVTSSPIPIFIVDEDDLV